MEISQNEIDNLKTYLCNRVAHARYYATVYGQKST